MNRSLKPLKNPLFLLLLAALTFACKDEEVAPKENVKDKVEESPTAKVNSWIFDQMQMYYYWEDLMPAEPDMAVDPMVFFDNLLYEGDRFSYIVPSYDELINSLNGVSKEAGYEFMLSRVSGSETEVVAIVLYIKEGSPASSVDLKRGDIISGINGKQITMSNYRSLLDEIGFDHSISFSRYNEEIERLEEQPPLDLQVVELSENPNFMDTVYQIGGKKIGYFVYNFFSPGSGEEYDAEVDQVISNFKSDGVTELILDLRYNSGGAVSSATNLASLVGKNIDETKIFYENRWNAAAQAYFESRDDGDEILRKRFLNKAEKIGENLSSGRLYVLTGSRTASASEMIINGLRPYMDVYLIGDQTVGKNVGSAAFNDQDNPENPYGLLPIIFQIFNSEGKTDYEEGFDPDASVNEFRLPMKALGDVEESLLAHALAVITGSGARIAAPEEGRYQVEPIMSSIDKKAYTNRAIIEMPERLR